MLNRRDRRGHTGKNIVSLRALWLIVLFFSACIPPHSAPSLNTPAGAGAVITRDTYQNDLFSLSYPVGWRAITSPAGAPPSVTLVAPGDCALIVVSSAPIVAPPIAPSCNQPDIQTVERVVVLGDDTISLAGSAPGAGWDEFRAALDRVAASIRAGA